MLSITKPKALIVARMSPRLNARTRRLMRALSTIYSVTVISESLNKVTPAIYELEGGKLFETPLPLYQQRIWYLSGALRVLMLNLKGILSLFGEKPHVIICSDGTQILPGIISKLLLGRSFVYNSHEIMWGLGIARPLSLLLGWLERIAISTCDFWLVPSEERAQLILEKHKLQKRYLVYENLPISNGGPEDRDKYRAYLQNAGVPLHEFVVMFQGSVTRQRGLEMLIEAAETGAFHLVIQGQGDLLPLLHKEANQHVTFLSPCPNDEVVSWLSAADASFVYYENDCINSAYACSNKFYGSVMAGVPIICNRLPAFESFAKHHGGVVFIDALTTEALLKSIQASLLDTNRYNLLKQQMLSARKDLDATTREEELSQAFAQLQ